MMAHRPRAVDAHTVKQTVNVRNHLAEESAACQRSGGLVGLEASPSYLADRSPRIEGLHINL